MGMSGPWQEWDPKEYRNAVTVCGKDDGWPALLAYEKQQLSQSFLSFLPHL